VRKKWLCPAPINGAGSELLAAPNEAHVAPAAVPRRVNRSGDDDPGLIEPLSTAAVDASA